MKTKRPIDELIRERRSCRSYDGKAAETDKRDALAAFLAQSTQEAQDIPARFVLVNSAGTGGKVGTYGMISGAQDYIVGITTKSARAEDFGFAFEKIILFATDLGLSTCWLAGVNRRTLMEKLELRENELVAVASPVGQAKASARDGLIRMIARADMRKPFEELFFDGQPAIPLARDKAGELAFPLEMARLAPSASNKQPLRVILAGRDLHFCIQRSKGYENKHFQIDIQKNDIGIAMCHFDLAARARGMEGTWEDMPGLETGAFEYVRTWRNR